MSKERVLALVSGGLDSYVMLHHFISVKTFNVEVVYFDYGNLNSEKEIEIVSKLCVELKIQLHIIKLDFFKYIASTISGEKKGASPRVPNRNGIFINIASGYAESMGFDSIALGVYEQGDNVSSDCKSEYIAMENLAVNTSTNGKIKIRTPYIKGSKADILKTGVQLGLNLFKSHTCYMKSNVHCGVCNACKSRIQAFKEADIEDKTIYETSTHSSS